jgi:two-component system response regulator YesN
MKLLIVDDGHYVVEYLKHLLDWKSFGIQQVRTTINSIEAKEILNANDIDILITDIRMPEVSGIDLLEHIHLHKLKTKVIFLSGYSQFDYAQKAIRLGVLDYLLKPVDKEDMEKAIIQAVKAIEALPRMNVAWENFDGLGFLLSVLCEAPSTKDSHYEPYAHELSNDHFCFFKLDSYTQIDEAIIHDYNDGLNCFVWDTERTLTGLVRSSNSRLLAERVQSIQLSSEFNLTHKNSVRIHFYQFFYGENISMNDYTKLQEILKLPSFIELENYRKNMVKRYNQLEESRFKLILLMELIMCLHTTNETIDKAEFIGWIFHALHNHDEALHSILTAFAQLEKHKLLSNEHTITMVRDYIDGHLANCLSLEELGEHVHLHPVYLSKLYKQETGENVSTYISTKRLEKAIDLLLESNLHVVDISQMVGYKKTQYFIKLFKEQYGVTPQQYRKQRQLQS